MAVINVTSTDTGTGTDILITRGVADVGTGVETWVYPHTLSPHAVETARGTETEYIRKTRSGVWLASYVGPGETESFEPEGVAGTYPGIITPPTGRV